KAVELLLHQLEKLEHHPRAALRVGRGPGRLRRFGVGDRVFHIRFAGEGHLRLPLAGIGVEDVAAAAGAARHGLAADEMADLAHGYSPSAPRSYRAAGACSLSDSAGCGAREASRKVRVHAQRVAIGLSWRSCRYAVAIEAGRARTRAAGFCQKSKGWMRENENPGHAVRISGVARAYPGQRAKLADQAGAYPRFIRSGRHRRYSRPHGRRTARAGARTAGHRREPPWGRRTPGRGTGRTRTA